MSWHYLQGQEEASWEGNCLDGAPSALSRLIPMRAESCLLDRLTDALTDSQSGTTCEPSTASDGAGRSMSSAEDFRVRTSAQPVEERESLGRGLGFGPRWHALSVRFDLVTCSWKTAHCLFQEDLQWSSVILPCWGMMRAGECWELAMSEPRISEPEFGWWPTPNKSDGTMKMLLTRSPETWVAQRLKNMERGVHKQYTLSVAVHFGVGERQAIARINAGAIPSQKGYLSPDWTEWLMIWPIGWTALQPLETDRFRQWLRLHGI